MWVRSRPGRKTRWRGLWTEEALCVTMWAGNANEWLRRMSRSRAGEWFVPKEILFTRERVEKIRQQRNSQTQSCNAMDIFSSRMHCRKLPMPTSFTKRSLKGIIFAVAYFGRWTISSSTIFGQSTKGKSALNFGGSVWGFSQNTFAKTRNRVLPNGPEFDLRWDLEWSWPLGCSRI